ncbi:MAG: cytidylate kinase-like family protein [Eubacteriales bacterium]|nr:cytidylate kinase-like family protein [Eubacteriales bacterium]
MQEKIELKKQLIITIGRQYGSGGRTVGKLLAEKLHISYYDEEILRLASEASAVGEEFFRESDENLDNKNLLNIIAGKKFEMGKPETGKNLTTPDNLFKFQSEVIKELATKESFVIIGRCANWILQSEHKNKVLRIFFYADYDTRVKRIMDQEKIERSDAVDKIKRKDRKREEYYYYFTRHEIVDLDNYDLMINTTTIGFPEILDIIQTFLKVRGFTN